MHSQFSELAARMFNGRISDSSVNIATPTVGTSVGWFVAHQNDKSVFVRIKMLNMQANGLRLFNGVIGEGRRPISGTGSG